MNSLMHHRDRADITRAELPVEYHSKHETILAPLGDLRLSHLAS